MKQLRRILLVDDDTVTNMLHRRVLERSGHVQNIDVATDGQEALDILYADLKEKRPLPELIFLDINMPGMGGFEFLERYKEMQLESDMHLIIVMLSTSLLEADHAKAEADPNVHCFCDKPLRLEKLTELVEELEAMNPGSKSHGACLG